MWYKALVLPFATLLVCATALAGQAYEPSYETPDGDEIVAVYLAAWSCVPCRGPEMPALLDSMKVQLQRQARARGQRFRAVFVGMDWDPEKSLEVATTDGPWDELIVGRNWFNAGAELFLSGDPETTPGMPQVIVYEQSISWPDEGVSFGPRRVLRRVLGAAALADWVAEGSPLGG